jgi:hypothetical protein
MAVAEQAARFFRRPSQANAFAAHEARLEARRETAAAVSWLKAGPDTMGGSRGDDWLGLLGLWGAAAEATAAAVSEAERFGVAGGVALAGVAAGLRDASRDAATALAALREGARCEELLVAAKRQAAEAERLRRGALAAALGEANMVTELKMGTVLRRLGDAAEAWQQAADAVAEVLRSVT